MITRTVCNFCIILLFSTGWLFFTCPYNAYALPSNCVKSTIFSHQYPNETALIPVKHVARTTHFVLHDPERVVVDIHGAFFPEVSRSKYTGGNIINRIRTSQNQEDVVRVVLDINQNTPYMFGIEQTDTGNSPGIKILLSSGRPLGPLPDKKIPAPSEPRGSGGTVALLEDTLPDDIFEDTGPQPTRSGVSISGEMYAGGTFQTREDDAVENNQTFRNRVLLEGKYKNRVTVSARSDYLYFSDENKTDDCSLDLWEAKWEYIGKKYGLSLGKQIVRWGKTDQISPVDTLNPQDFREFIIPDYEERKIPVWMANARWFSEYFTLEGVLIPFFEESKWDYFGTNWSVFSHVKEELQGAVSDPALKAYINNLSVRETDPGTGPEFAVRLHTTIKNMDLGFTFHRMTEDNPYHKNFPIKHIRVNGSFSGNAVSSALGPAAFTDEDIEVTYWKTNAAGFEFETTWNEYGIRGDILWMENQSFLTSALTSSRHPAITAVMGVDHTAAAGNTYVNFQMLYSRIRDYSGDILYFDRDSFSLLGEIKQDLASDWLQGGVKYNISLNNASHYLSPYFKYTYVTNLECIAGIGFFFGDEDTWFGRYRDYDFFYVDVKYQF